MGETVRVNDIFEKTWHCVGTNHYDSLTNECEIRFLPQLIFILKTKCKDVIDKL